MKNREMKKSGKNSFDDLFIPDFFANWLFVYCQLILQYIRATQPVFAAMGTTKYTAATIT
jgi:hypothetical protein